MKKGIAAVSLILAVALAIWWFFQASTAQKDSSAAVPAAKVMVEAAYTKVLPLVRRAAGQVASKHSVAIQPQVSGMLQSVHFDEGAPVSKGQLLLVIDPAPFEARLLAARAAYESAKATAQRSEELRPKGFVTDQQYDDALTAREQVKADVRLAEIDLAYTRIRSPIDGLAGALSVKPGNLVTAGGQTLVTINQVQPAEVVFTLPQDALATVKRQQAIHPLTVNVQDESGRALLAHGELTFLSNQIDPANGTFLLKASVPNADEALWPGQFVTVDLVLDYQQELVVPAIALHTGQVGNFVYQVKNGKVEATVIALDREQGNLAVVASGLEAGDEVIVQAPRSLRVGMAASVETVPPAATVEQGAAQ